MFKWDSPFTKFLVRIADLLILNVIVTVFSIPIFTFGASFTGLHYVMLRMVRKEEGYLFQDFLKSFKQNFKQATLIWLIFLACIIVFVMDATVMKEIEFSNTVYIVLLVAAVLVAFIFMYAFPILAKFDNTVKNTLKNAFLMSIHQLPKSVLMLVCYLIPFLIYWFLPQVLPIAFLMGFSLPVMLSAMLYNKFFQKLEDQIIAANEQAEGPEEAEEESAEAKEEESAEKQIEQIF